MAIQAVSGERTRKRSRRHHRHPWLRRIARLLLFVASLVLLSIVVFRFVNPPITPVMLVEKLKGNTLRRDWVPLRRYLAAASAGGDRQRGRPLLRALGRRLGRGARGGQGRRRPQRGCAAPAPSRCRRPRTSISWNGRSYVRKALEVPLAYVMSALWPKQRMMEVYLNVAQFGPGIFGAEAASRYYFHKSAADLTRREAVLLAAALPNPRFSNPARPSRAHAHHRQGGRAAHADHRAALGLRLAAAIRRFFKRSAPGHARGLPL